MRVTARVMPIPKARQKSMPVAIWVLIVSIPRAHRGSRPSWWRTGLTAVCTTTPAKEPMTDQNGISRPAKMGPRWRVTPRGAAGRKLPK